MVEYVWQQQSVFKNALDEANGDAEKALELIRIKGLKGATKREGRSTAEGLVAAKVIDGTVGVMIGLYCETEFVAKNDRFTALADKVLDVAVSSAAADLETLLAVDVEGKTLADVVTEEGAILGETVVVRSISRIEGATVAAYLHKTSDIFPTTLGVLFAVNGTGKDAESIAHDMAIHTAKMAPDYFSREDISAETVDDQRRIAMETAVAAGESEAALPKIVEGHLTNFFKERVLVEQAFTKDVKKSVAQALEDAGVQATAFARDRLGGGIWQGSVSDKATPAIRNTADIHSSMSAASPREAGPQTFGLHTEQAFDTAASDSLLIELSVLDDIFRSGVVEDIDAPLGSLSLGGSNSLPVYPIFQFQAIQPYILHRVFTEVGPLLGQQEDPIGAASWWLTSNAWLNSSPAELLGKDRDMEIVFAAEQLKNDSW